MASDDKKRMAGDALMESTEDSSADQSAKEAGFRNENERRLGTEEYDRLSGSGLQDADNKGAYSAKEVISEMRDGRDGKTTEEMADYYQGLADSGTKFNKRAQDFLSSRHGVSFGDDIGKTPEPPSDGGGGTSPLPTPPETGTPSPQPPVIAPGIPSPFGNSQTQIVTQDNDQTSTINGDGNTVNQGQDNSVSQSMGYGSGRSFKDSWMKNYFK